MQTALSSYPPKKQINGLGFNEVQLIFDPGTKTNLFAWKNNKALGETICAPRYHFLAGTVYTGYQESLLKPLGTFLVERKLTGDMIYKKFLNSYGDETYSRFYIQGAEWLHRKGLYCYLVGEIIMYIGQSKDSFVKRINQGYGNISTKNCYLDGQATNCHINSLITNNKAGLTLLMSEINDLSVINSLEKGLIQTYQPVWNIALKH
jgi:hypothetical protein